MPNYSIKKNIAYLDAKQLILNLDFELSAPWEKIVPNEDQNSLGFHLICTEISSLHFSHAMDAFKGFLEKPSFIFSTKSERKNKIPCIY